MGTMGPLTVPPMTQDRSRALGRAIIGWAALQLLLALRGCRDSPWWLALPALLVVAALSAFLGWVGYTLVVIDWDAPADYPPASPATPPPAPATPTEE